MKNRLALTRTGMRSSRLLSCFAAVFISTVMPDYSDALRYGLTLALLAAYTLLCLSIWQRQRRRRLAAVAEAAQAMQAAGLTPAGGGAFATVSTGSSGAGQPAHPENTPVLIAWATQTGMAQTLAKNTAAMLQACGQAAQAAPLALLDADALRRAARLLVVASTYGDGEPPDEAVAFEKQHMRQHPPLHGLRYAVLALGDSSYDNFCQFGQAIDGWLASSGGQRLFACIKADSADDFEMNAALAAWRKQLAAAFGLDAAQLARWQPKQPSEASGWHDWTLAAKTRLNPGSAGSPVWLLELTAPAGASLTWEAGDLAQIAPPADAKNPRDYSIASIPQSGRLQLLVRRQNRADGSPGLCSAWLTDELQAGQTLPVRLRANAGFHLGGNAERALILIGNGVGLAGLLAHLHAREAAGQRRNWLIFGERNAAHDWLCHEQIARWQASGHLPRVDAAFSRDSAPGAPKTYVQTVLAREAATLRQWMDEGAALYVCGSLSGMAAGVDAVLRQTLGSERVDALLAERRYCRDVY